MQVRRSSNPHERPVLVTNSVHVHTSEEEASDEESERRSKKAIPEWAQKENLRRELFHQFVSRGTSFDPTPSIFPEFASTCDLEAIFPAADPEKKRRFEKRRRGSAIPNSRHS